MSDNEFIKINNVSKNFENVIAVNNVNVNVARGEFFSLLGPSGCGKTTLLRILAGFEYPSSGKVLIDNVDVTDITPNLRPTNMVFQNYAIFPHINVKRNIEFGLRKEKLSKDELEQRVKNALKMVQLEGYEDRYSNQLSGGQRQRIGIARALAVEPEFIVCDEPVSALDVSIQAQIINLLQDLQEEFGLTYLFIAHDLSVVRHISDRVAVMYLGHIMELTDRDSIFENPLHPYTKALLSAVPIPDPALERERERIILTGDVPSPLAPPSGCVFHTRCPIVVDECKTETPEWRNVGTSSEEHWVWCHRV